MEVRPGYKNTDLGVIPIDWDVMHLGDVGEALIGLTYKPTNVHSDGVLVLRSSNIQEGILVFDDNVFVRMDIPEKCMVKKGDILICVRNGSRDLIGKCAYIDDRALGMAFGAFMTVYRSTYHPFIFHQFQSQLIKRQIHAHLGATINQITNKSLNSFRIPLPPKVAEQTAIADALTDADLLIEFLEELLTKKRQIKQGAMQELLSGEKRLHGYSGAIEKKKLGVFSQIEKGEQLNKDTLSPTGDYPVWNGGIEPSGFTNKWNTHENMITVSEGGNSCGFVNFITKKFWRGGHCYALKNTDMRNSQKYVYQFLKYHENDIMALRVGSGLPNIQRARLLNFEVSLPSIDEQTAIAEILSDMDTEIATLEDKLTKARQVKQGMLQELLTGRIRLI
jgi:type I restriction enzyme, S subunit